MYEATREDGVTFDPWTALQKPGYDPFGGSTWETSGAA